jgi:hypothetical protein
VVGWVEEVEDKLAVHLVLSKKRFEFAWAIRQQRTRTSSTYQLSLESGKISIKRKGDERTLFDVPPVELERKVLFEPLDVVLDTRVIADGLVVAELDEGSEVSMVLGEFESLLWSTNRHWRGASISKYV